MSRKKNVHICIKNRYQGVFSEVTDVYIVFWYIVANQSFVHLYLRYVDDVE